MSRVEGPVLVVGCGLLGTSVALACRRGGVDVLLDDLSRENVRTASGLGAGRPRRPEDQPKLVVIAVPPDHLAAAITTALRETDAVVTDVGSIKSRPLREVAAAVTSEQLARYVGSHPMAGSERSGPLAGTAALFDGRPWAVTPHEAADPEAIAVVEALAELAGGAVVRLDPDEHDAAVARTSHLPHLLSVLMADRLTDAPADHLALAGQGLRDVTRVAGSDPVLWRQIVSGNAPSLLGLLVEVRDRLDHLIAAVSSEERDELTELLDRGVAGTRAIPGKHGGPTTTPTASVFVSIPDQPGALARIFADVGESEVNVEDVRIDHDLARQNGLLELVVDAARADELLASLEGQGWLTHR